MPPEGEVKKPLIPVRYFQAFLLFLGMVATYYLRVIMSIAIIPMTDPNATDIDDPTYDWEEKRKSYILSSFFWGYILTQVLGGYLAHEYGAKIPIFCALLGCSLFGTLLPLGAEMGDWPVVLALRATQGLFQGMTFPAVHGFIAQWAPVQERGAFVSFIYSGLHLGTVLALNTGGYIATTPLGWRGSFYIPGVFGIVWSILWLFFSASTPASHKFISAYERNYILKSFEDKNRISVKQGKPLKLPLLRIFTSGAYWALLIPYIANGFGFWALLTEMPTYFHTILHITITKNGPLFSITYIFYFLNSLIFIWVDEMIKKYKLLSHNISRKMFNTIGQLTPAICLMVIGFLRASDWAVALVAIGVSSNAATYFGIMVNHIDLSPNFAGHLMGIMNTFGNIAALFAPITVGLIVWDENDPNLWRIVFFVAAGIFFMATMVFNIFGKTNLQDWNDVEAEKENEKEKDQNK